MTTRSWSGFLRHALRHPYAWLPRTPSGIINSARDWVAERQRETPVDIRRGPPAQVWDIDPPGLHSLPARRSVGDESVPRGLGIFPTRGTALYFIKGARVLGREGTVISPDNRVFAEFTYVDAPGGIERHSVFHRRRVPKAVPLAGWYATLCYPSASAYAHWLVESLPRLKLLEPHLHALDGLFVPSELPPTMHQSLLAFGVREDQIVPLSMASHFAPEHLLVPAYCAGLDVPAWAVDWLRTHVDVQAAAPHRRLYVSRAKVSRRRALNEDALLPVLQRWGFQVVHPQEFAFREQVRLFAEASVVAGPSGSGMFNALFCPRGGALIEIPPHPSIGAHYYYSIAAAAGLDFWVVPGSEPVEARAQLWENADFRADPQALDRTLQRVLSPQDAHD